MTTKILTVRVPTRLYSSLCTSAADTGVPVSAYIRHLVEQEHEAVEIAALRTELLTKLDTLFVPANASLPNEAEILLLLRAIAAHLNPQLVTQVRARLAATQKGD